MREIVLDTETTGLDPFQGHRLVEIGCIELVNRIPSGHTFHTYLNPERDMPAEAFSVHGLSAEFLSDKPLFMDVVADFVAFLGDAPLVIHNAAFDIGFINAELDRVGKPSIGRERLVDTLLLARRKYPGGSNRLDDLCGRFGIDNSRRTKHGALLDAELLAEVYLELIEARQAQLGLAAATQPTLQTGSSGPRRARPTPLLPRITDAERTAHRAFVDGLGPAAVWRHYRPMPDSNAASAAKP
jgi:DNA polymerase III subunit epsilon